MLKTVSATALAVVMSSAAMAQSVGVGVGYGSASSSSSSSSRATGAAIFNAGNQRNVQRTTASGGAGGAGGVAYGGSVTINDPPSTQNSGTLAGASGSGNRWSYASANYPKQAPGVAPPALAPAGIESCMASMSLGGSGAAGALAFGFPIRDGACNARLNARTLYNLGYRGAAAQALCLDGDLAQALSASGVRCAIGPQAQQQPQVAYQTVAAVQPAGPAAIPAAVRSAPAHGSNCLKWSLFAGCTQWQ